MGVKVYTVGVGSEEPRPVQITDDKGRPQIVELKVESDALREIAAETGGKYFLASDADALSEVYKEIDKLETTVRTVHEMRHVREAFAGPAMLAASFLFLELLQLLFGRVRLP